MFCKICYWSVLLKFFGILKIYFEENTSDTLRENQGASLQVSGVRFVKR